MRESLSTAAAAVLLVLMTAGPASGGSRLQVFVTSDPEKAENVGLELNTAGFGPALVAVGKDGLCRVSSREFATYGEANLVKGRVRGMGFHGAFVVDSGDGGAGIGETKKSKLGLPAIDKPGFLSEVGGGFAPPARRELPAAVPGDLRSVDDDKASHEDLYRKSIAVWDSADLAAAQAARNAFLKRFPSSSKAPAVKKARAYGLIRAGLKGEAKVEFLQIAADHPGTLEAGEASLRLAYMGISDNEPADAVLRAFRNLAEGKIPASDEVRVEAALRTAALYHRGSDIEAADRIYSELETAVSDTNFKAYAKVQRAALTLENAWNGKATMAQAGAQAEAVLREFPDAEPSTRATAALLAMESLSYQSKFAEVAARATSFNEVIQNTPEAPVGRFWIARAYAETGNDDAAVKMLDSILAIDAATGMRFARLDLKRASSELNERCKQRLKAALGKGADASNGH